MKIELSNGERDYLADKTFWDWKRAEVDVWSARNYGNKESKEYFDSWEKFYRELYNKLKIEEKK